MARHALPGDRWLYVRVKLTEAEFAAWNDARTSRTKKTERRGSRPWTSAELATKVLLAYLKKRGVLSR